MKFSARRRRLAVHYFSAKTMKHDTRRSDAWLLAAWNDQGDRRALEILVSRYAPLVLGVCRRQCRTTHDADDAFQVTFMVLARSAHTIRKPEALACWLHGTAFRVSARTRTTERPKPAAIEDSAYPAPGDDPLETLARRHDLEVLDEELLALPTPTRAAIVLHYLDGHRVTEVAAQLGISVGSARGLLQRGRGKLRRRLLLRGVSLGSAIACVRVDELRTIAEGPARLAIESLHQHPDLYAPRPDVAPPDAIPRPNTPADILLTPNLGVVMKSVHAAVTALLALTVWASQQGYGPGTGDGKGESLVVGPAPSAEPAASEAAVTRILPVVDPLFQFGDGGGAGQPPSQDPFDPSGDPFDLSDPQPSAAAAAAAEEQGARRPEGPQQKKPKKGSQAAGGPGAAGGGGKLGGPGAAGGGGALGGAGAWNSGHPAGVVPGGGAGGGYGGVVAPKALSSRSSGDTTTERSQFERQLLKLLEESFEADLQANSAAQLADTLQQTLGVPFMIRDEPQLEGVDYEGATAAVPAGLPLGVALKTALRPLRLRPIVRDDAIVFVPDTAALARAGLETAHYVNLDDDFMQRVSDALRKPHNLSFTQIPLEDVLLQLSEETELSFQINERALEDLGLSVDLPISVRSKDAPLQEGLRMILDPVELTLRPRDGYIEVTTREEAEEPENQVLRLYWLDGTGFRSGDAALRVIETLINPDIWETVGGPATMSYLDNSAGDRLGLAFSTTFETHQQIERLLATLRKKLVDPQPQVETGRQKTPGMGGMGGGGTM